MRFSGISMCIPQPVETGLAQSGIIYTVPARCMVCPAVSRLDVLSVFQFFLSAQLFCARSGSIRPRLSAIWKPILFLCFVIPPIYWFDLHFHANYMFLQLSSEGSPLLLLSQLAGGNTAGYLILFSIVVFGMMLSMDLLYLRFSAHKK